MKSVDRHTQAHETEEDLKKIILEQRSQARKLRLEVKELATSSQSSKTRKEN